MKTRTLTLAETKARCAFYGYSVKKECGEFRAYPKGKPELDVFETDGWALFQTVRAAACHAFEVKVDNLDMPNEYRAALCAWFYSEGADWKRSLHHAWMTGNYNGHACSGTLQRLRNSTFGYEIIDSL